MAARSDSDEDTQAQAESERLPAGKAVLRGMGRALSGGRGLPHGKPTADAPASCFSLMPALCVRRPGKISTGPGPDSA